MPDSAPNPKWDVFLSYSREDVTFAERLASVLHDEGWTVWWDRRIPPGRRYSDVIDEALSAAGCVVVLWSSTSISRDWVLEEAEDAKKRDALVPALIEQVQAPRGFRRIEAAELWGWDRETRDHSELEILFNAIAHHVPRRERNRRPGSSAQKDGSTRLPAASQREPSEAERLVASLADPSLTPARRAEIGRELGRLGDPRPGVGLRPDGVPDIDWVTIPAGTFLIGSRDDDAGALEHEKPQREIRLPEFRIARVPVTNVQYQSFIGDGGYRDKWKRAWSDEGWGWKEDRTEPQDYDPIFQSPNHPRGGVTWYEAQAFCNWLSAKLGTSVGLPSDEQWEKAARGTDGRNYPWGNSYDAATANGLEAGVRSTTAVGIFPSGASPYGVLDMSGNVWEWCADDVQGSRVLRGGSFAINERGLRCAGRLHLPPVLVSNDLGFRVSSD